MPDSEWEAVRTALAARLLPLMDNPERAHAWLDALKDDSSSGLHGKVLGVCVALDILSGAIPASTYANLLERLPDDGASALSDFDIARKGRFDGWLPTEDESGEGAVAALRYVRVLALGTFIKYYATPDLAFTLDDAEEVKHLYFESPQGRDLAAGTGPWSGRAGRVWLMKSSELDEVSSELEPHELPTLLNDGLGLGLDSGHGASGKAELVLVRYPPKARTPTCTRPAALDRHWYPPTGYFVSSERSGIWGRTQSCSGEARVFDETVHGAVESLEEGYRCEYLGEADDPQSDHGKLLSEAYKRYAQLVEEQESLEGADPEGA